MHPQFSVPVVLGRGRDRQGLAARITHLLHKHEGQVVVAVHLRFQSLEAGRQRQQIPGASWAHLGTLPQWQGEGWQSVQMSVSDPHIQAHTHRLACAGSMHMPYTCKIRKSKQAEPSLPRDTWNRLWHQRSLPWTSELLPTLWQLIRPNARVLNPACSAYALHTPLISELSIVCFLDPHR